MLDAVRFEELGLPAVAIVTEPFTATGKVMAELQGFTDYPFATVPHPVASLSDEQVEAVADGVTATVERLLLRAVADAPPPDAARRTAAGLVSLEDVVETLAEALRADRADLTAEQSGSRITFRLHIPDEACAECVMPSSMLVPMFQHRVDQELGPGLTVELEDPRTSVS
ncbi:MAG: hypothetical protein F4Y05_07780 [Acidimicrobiaceae bacterium]|nr:hypothetical protein [Acidimicrobiaceae bacterium]MYE09488.1 hypothetical protein [Acidimicrobiaceae bacterium]MYI37009.1 hypothetical protein [Acidimicrobiaceae bacterium]